MEEILYMVLKMCSMVLRFGLTPTRSSDISYSVFPMILLNVTLSITLLGDVISH